MNRELKIITAAAVLLISTCVVYAKDGNDKGIGKQFKHKVRDHYQGQKAENKDFMESLNDKSPEERYSLMKQYREERFEENRTFQADIHKEKMEALRSRLNQSKLSDDKKADIIKKAEGEYEKNKTKVDRQHKENIDFVESVHNDKALSDEERKEKIKAYFKTQRDEKKELQENMREERKQKIGINAQ